MLLTLGLLCFVVGFVTAIFLPEIRLNWFKSYIRMLFRLPMLELPSEKVQPAHTNDIQPNDKLLWTKTEVEDNFTTDSWQRMAYEDFTTKIQAKEAGMKTYPCIYATMGYRSDDHRYIFLESDNPSEARNVRIIAPGLRQYLKDAHELGPNTSLVIFGSPSTTTRSLPEYNRNFWDMLRGLRMVDRQAWPKDVPTQVMSEKWTFAFEGISVFPVMLTPAHSRRWSRQMSVLLIAVQPTWVLDKLLSPPEKGKAVQNNIHKLIREYDQVEVSPYLGVYGEPGTSEARTLCLLDDNNEMPHIPFANMDEE